MFEFIRNLFVRQSHGKKSHLRWEDWQTHRTANTGLDRGWPWIIGVRRKNRRVGDPQTRCDVAGFRGS